MSDAGWSAAGSEAAGSEAPPTTSLLSFGSSELSLAHALTGLACGVAALLLLVALCIRTRLRRRQLRAAAPPLLADDVSDAQRSRLLELQFYLRSCMEYRMIRTQHEQGRKALQRCWSVWRLCD